MDKSLILSVAGSGKTFHLVENTNLRENFIILSYTNSGIEAIRLEVLKKYGHIPLNIRIVNFFSFLYTFCYKPYLSDVYKDKGITWKSAFSHFDNNFLNKYNYIYGNRLSKVVLEKCSQEVKLRIEKYFDYLLIDEIQDFASSDFNFILDIIQGNYNVMLVGDFNQHTFDTSRDGNIKKSLHANLDNFVQYFNKIGFEKDDETLVKSRRCSQNVCDFISNKLQINIQSFHSDVTELKLLENDDEIKQVFHDNEIVKLFTMMHYKYPCNSNNWGNCKGLTYRNVCVVINDEILKQFHNQSYIFKSQITKNKFYVACSRTKGNLYFVSDKKVKKYKT